MTELLIGCDPEVFLLDKATKKPISAYGLVPGTKKEPYHVVSGTVQVDGMAAEIGIHPAKNLEEFIDEIESVMKDLEMMVPQCELAIIPVMNFTEEDFASVPKESSELGCDPDFNAYTGEPNPTPDGKVLFRTGAGHIHLGWTKDEDVNDPGHIEACRMLARQLDCYLGLQSLLYDDCHQRRQLYGKAGAYRVKPYGLEYRTLSNYWLKDRRLMREVFRSARAAFNSLLRGLDVASEMRKLNYDIPHIINNGRNKVGEVLEALNYVNRRDPRWLREYHTSLFTQEACEEIGINYATVSLKEVKEHVRQRL